MVQAIRHKMQASTQRTQPENLLEEDEQAETDEMYQNAEIK